MSILPGILLVITVRMHDKVFRLEELVTVGALDTPAAFALRVEKALLCMVAYHIVADGDTEIGVTKRSETDFLSHKYP